MQNYGIVTTKDMPVRIWKSFLTREFPWLFGRFSNDVKEGLTSKVIYASMRPCKADEMASRGVRLYPC